MNEQSQVAGYATIVKIEETTDGNLCYVARHPELPTVIGQGDTAKEAKEDLAEATELAIEHLIANNLPVPQPMLFGSDRQGLPEVEIKYSQLEPPFPRKPSSQTVILPPPEMVTA